MNHRVPCETIQDLMPTYTDGLTPETTDREICSHLEERETCKEMYERMRAETEGDTSQTAGRPPEIDYLERVRRKNVRDVVLVAAGVFLSVAAALLTKLFVIGYPTESYVLTYTDVNGEQVNVGRAMADSTAIYRGYKLMREDGTKKLVICSCPPSFWNRNGTPNSELAPPGGGMDLNIQGITTKSNGDLIGSLANELYRARNPYMDDVSADGKLSGALGISRELGSFKNELQIPDESCGWALNLEESTSNSVVFGERMKVCLSYISPSLRDITL